jgi:hypothetical protein
MGKRLVLSVLLGLTALAGCTSVPEPFDGYNIIYFIDRAIPGYISPDNLRRELGVEMLTGWEQVAAAIQDGNVDALLIGPGMIEQIEDEDLLRLHFKRGLTLVFFNIPEDEVVDLTRIPYFSVNWYQAERDADLLTGNFVIGAWRMTACADGEAAYTTLFQPCVGSQISENQSSSFAGELNTDWDTEKFLHFFGNHLEQVSTFSE